MEARSGAKSSRVGLGRVFQHELLGEKASRRELKLMGACTLRKRWVNRAAFWRTRGMRRSPKEFHLLRKHLPAGPPQAPSPPAQGTSRVSFTRKKGVLVRTPFRGPSGGAWVP